LATTTISYFRDYTKPKSTIALGLFYALTFVLAWLVAPSAQAQDRKGKQPLTNPQAEEIFIEAMKQNMLGDKEKALSYLAKAADANPENGSIYYKIADIKAGQNKLKEAEEYINKALELSEDNKYFYMLGAEIALNQQKFKEGAKLLTKALKKFPYAEDIYPYLAETYVAQREYDQALKVYDRYHKNFGPTEETSRQKQSILLKMNKLGLAIEEAKNLVAAYTDEPAYGMMLVEMLLSNEKISEAENYIKEHNTSLATQPTYHLLLYEIAIKKGKGTEAQREMMAALGHSDLPLENKIKYLGRYFTGGMSAEDSVFIAQALDTILVVHASDARAYILKADFLASRGQVEQARALYTRSLAFDETKFAVWEQIVKIDLDLQEMDSLIAHTDRAVEFFPTNGVFWFYNGVANAAKKRNEKAIIALERAKKFSLNNEGILKDAGSWLGDLYHGEKKFESSDLAYADVLALDSLNAHVLNNWGYYLSLREEKLALAERLGRKLMAIEPNEATYQDTYGWILYKAKKYDAALPFLEKAGTVSDASGTVQEHLGDLYFQLGQTEKALEYWQKAAKNKPEQPEMLQKKIRQRTVTP